MKGASFFLFFFFFCFFLGVGCGCGCGCGCGWLPSSPDGFRWRDRNVACGVRLIDQKIRMKGEMDVVQRVVVVVVVVAANH